MSGFPQLWIGMSARELRDQEFPVSDDIPDHALLGPREIDASVDVRLGEGNRLDVTFPIAFEWRWIRPL